MKSFIPLDLLINKYLYVLKYVSTHYEIFYHKKNDNFWVFLVDFYHKMFIYTLSNKYFNTYKYLLISKSR